MNKVLESLREVESKLRGSEYWGYYTENYLKEVYEILSSEATSVIELQAVVVRFIETRFLPILENIVSKEQEREAEYQEMSSRLARESERVSKLGDHYKAQIDKITQYEIIEKDLLILQQKVAELQAELDNKNAIIQELEKRPVTRQNKSEPVQGIAKETNRAERDLDIDIIPGPRAPGLVLLRRYLAKGYAKRGQNMFSRPAKK
jgi:hypothetical protein